MELTYENLQQYLKGETGQTVEIEEIHQLSGLATGPQALKQFGYGRLAGPFQELHERFWERYLATRPDDEMVAVIQPWFAWRSLVLASPIWYPTISEENRRKLLTFARNLLATERYDYRQVNHYFEEA
jgi:hypothetical protein